MHVLGTHFVGRASDSHRSRYSGHDAAAALVSSAGVILAAVEQERLDRVKHSNFFPQAAINSCLKQAALSLDEIDFIAIPISEPTLDAFVFEQYWFDSRVKEQTGRGFMGEIFERRLGVANLRAKLRFAEHHESHAWSAFGVAGYDQALILVLDGDGEGDTSGLVGVGSADGIAIQRRFTASRHSLGLLYQGLIHFVGYHRFDEYKVMGLAPYGDPKRFERFFSRICVLKEDGDYAISLDPHALMSVLMEEGLSPHIRRKGAPIEQVHKDFAAALQQTTERVILHVLEHYQKKTGLGSLCLAGGVGHNCTANGRVHAAGLFDSVYFQPVAHDAGLSLGSAFQVMHQATQRPVRVAMPHLYFGRDTPSDPGPLLARWSAFIDSERVAEVEAHTAELIANGQAIAWVQGRSEFGPRALGNRSILADPRPAENKQRINHLVKKREEYRPFAPSVLAERIADIFEVPKTENRTLPFMISTLFVKPEWRQRLGAITHVDGSARVQAVERETNPRYWQLIKELDGLTGVPIVLNTSLNNNIEPIVDTVDEAVACLLTTGLDTLIVGDYVVKKKSLDLFVALAACSVHLPKNRFLTVAEGKHRIDATSHPYMGQTPVEISSPMFDVLRRAGEQPGAALRELCQDADSLASLAPEFMQLWELRAVVVVPKPAQPGL